MKNLFIGIRIAIYIILGFWVISFIIYEINPKIDYKSNFLTDFAVSSYLGLKGFFFSDPYDEQILNEVQEFEAAIRNSLTNRQKVVTDFGSDAVLQAQILAYFDTKKTFGIDTLMKQYFGNYPDLVDLMLIDKNFNVIYKYGGESLSIEYREISNTVLLTNLNNRYGLIYEIQDQSVDFDVQIIALFDYSYLESLIQKTTFPAFLHIHDTLYRSKTLSKPEYEAFKEQIPRHNEIYLGAKTLKIIRIDYNRVPFLYAGIIYPVRDISGFFFGVWKFIVFLFLLLIIFLIDRGLDYLGNILGTPEASVKGPKKIVGFKGGKKSIDAGDDEHLEQNLQWVEDYIYHNEQKIDRKKGEDEK